MMFSEDHFQSNLEDWNDPEETCVMKTTGLIESATGSLQISIDSVNLKRHKREHHQTQREHLSNILDNSTEGIHRNNQALKLFDICIDLIADKLYLVENFICFPDEIGHKIFTAAVSKDMFYSFANTIHRSAMTLFCEAYEHQVLTELNVSGKPWLPPNLLSALGIFQHIVKLDVTGCRIGNTDSAITHISKFTCLDELNLQENQLRDSHIRTLTAPLRMFNNGAIGLLRLSLSCNPQLTDDCAKHLLCYKNLEHLDLSGTKFQKLGLELLQKRSHLRFRNVPSSMCRSPICSTQGWAADVVLNWLEQGRPRTKDEIRSTNRSKNQIEDRNPVNFYAGIAGDDVSSDDPKPQPDPVMVLHKTRLLRMDQTYVVGHVQDLSTKKKRQDNKFSLDEALNEITAEDADQTNIVSEHKINEKTNRVLKTRQSSNRKSHQDKKIERSKVTDKDDNDDDMLKSYVKPTSEAGNPVSLWSAMSSNHW